MLRRLYDHLNSLTGRVTGLLVAVAAVCVWVMAGIGYSTLNVATEENAGIRIDRAARAATSILAHAVDDVFTVRRDGQGRPTAIEVPAGGSDAWTRERSLTDLVLEIGRVNQGAANLFAFNETTKGFDRFATTFRKPDGAMPPPMSITQGHPAYAALAEGLPFVGQVPVMGRMRLAYLTPVTEATPPGVAVGPGARTVRGAMAVDVGWVDDLTTARNGLRERLVVMSTVILLAAALVGVLIMMREMRHLKALARFANAVASGTDEGDVPYLDRRDEVGALAQGLGRVAVLQDELEYLAYTDVLTGRGNRARYLADLERFTAPDAIGARPSGALLHIDLDRFKEINDAFGQTVGDGVLVRVADILAEAVGPQAHVARVAGDDFTVLTAACVDPEALLDLCQTIVSALDRPIVLPEGETQIGACIGVVMLPRDANDADEAHRNAEIALRRAKKEGRERGRGRFVFFAKEFNDAVQSRILLQRRLRSALDERLLTVHLQPQVDAKDQSLFGLEALVRWPDAERGMIPPSEFIPLAEATGMIDEVGAFVLDESCRLARLWRDEGFAFGHVAINVSPMQLRRPRFTDEIAEILARHGLPGEAICLEVTEGVFVDHDEGRIQRILGDLRDLGVCLSLDDFGSGYSSLGYLNRLPFDQLKIDRSFVSDVDLDPRKENLLRGVLALGSGLGMKIVVEGTETMKEVALVREIGCDAIQGYAYARPVPAEALKDEVARIAREFGRGDDRGADACASDGRTGEGRDGRRAA